MSNVNLSTARMEAINMKGSAKGRTILVQANLSYGHIESSKMDYALWAGPTCMEFR
jgi:hypothetical protein